MMHSLRLIFRVPLFRLLAVNLAIGTSVAVLLVGSLFAFNLYGLRDLIVADYSPVTALGLLLFGVFMTFGSTAMGTAIMALGGLADGSANSGGGGRRVRAPANDERATIRVPVR
jgi:hypothetical protein